MKYILYCFAALLPVFSVAQVTIGANTPPDPSATLDIQSTNGGLLYPRLTTAQRNAIVNPAVGLIIYNATTNCVQTYFPLSGWQDVRCDCQSFPSSAFTFPNSISANAAASFVATTPGMTYSWTFQGGSPGTGTNQTESVTWASPGSYTVTLTVTDNSGCNSTTTQTVTVVNCPPPFQNTITFNYTGAVQTWTVPACVTAIQVDARGAQGGNGQNSATGGNGGRVEATMTVTPGQVLNIFVGQQGFNCDVCLTGAYNGGGGTSSNNNQQPGTGGGASDIRIGGVSLTDRIIVAGGGGGGGYTGSTSNGGAGGGLTGATGSQWSSYASGTGGTQLAGGTGGNGSTWGQPDAGNGVLGAGGRGQGWSGGGGGGGGGYYGGGGGFISGGGGGSSYVTVNGTSNITHTQGSQTGNGQITILY